MLQETDVNCKEQLSKRASDLETKASAENGKSRRSFKKPVSMPDVLSSITAGQLLRLMLSAASVCIFKPS